MRVLLVVGFVALPLLAFAQTDLGTQSQKAGKVVEKAVSLHDAKGNQAPVKRVLIENTDGSYTYRYDDQPKEAKQYHDDLCARVGGKPSKNDVVIRGEDAVGSLTCDMPTDQPAKAGVMMDGQIYEAEHRGTTSSSGGMASRQQDAAAVPDYATANGPVGIAKVAENF